MNKFTYQAWIDYSIQVDVAGTYNLAFRVGGAIGSFEIQKGDQALASVTSTQKDWHTVNVSVPLPAGAQTIRVRPGASNQSINWIEFTRR